MADDVRNARILGYWAKVEALIAPDAEKRTEKILHGVVSYLRDGDFPWQQKLLELPHKHFVRFGVFPHRAYEKELLKFLGATKEPPDQGSGIYADEKELTFLGVFEVDQDGLPQAGTLDMAAFAPAFASLTIKRDISFEDYKKRIAETFDEAADAAAEKKLPVTRELLNALASDAIKRLDWTPPEMDGAPLAVVRTVATKNERGYSVDASLSPINGFFFDDICKVQLRVRAEKPVGLVGGYLSEPDEQARTESTSLDNLEHFLTVERMPDGRWPSKHPLTLMQQVAVNQAFTAMTGKQPIFSVNGPPGTGKTTLLMDLVAAIVVERAKVLCDFDDPSSAFEKKWDVQYQGLKKPVPVYALDKRLHGFSIVVASSNNGAVENITRELPNLSKLSPEYREADYFKQLATVFINNTESEGEGDEAEDQPDPIEGWGLVSAPLGKKKNRNLFINTLKAKVRVKAADGSTESIPAPHNIFRLLDEARAGVNWGTVRKSFTDALTKVQRIKAELNSVGKLKATLAGLGEQVKKADSELRVVREKLSSAIRDEPVLQQDVTRKEKGVREAQSGLDNLLPARPGFFSRLFDTASFRAWLGDWNGALKKHREMRQHLNVAESSLQKCQQALIELPRSISAAEEELALRQTGVKRANESLNKARGENFSDFDDLRKMDPDHREQALPLSNNALHGARGELLLRAMDLHKAFATSVTFSKNLKRSLDMLDNRAELRPILAEAAIHLWETLFLLVPVVSSTFHSMARAFSHLEAGKIGWLLIDEAGQAVPQHAVGALYRSRRAIIVGDPLQIEPVIRFNKTADATLLKISEAPLRYQSTATSVQVLADGIHRYGAHLNGNWVGCPLRVHRRCIEPMFSISNELAYDGTMVLGNGKLDEETKLAGRSLLGPTRWFDVTGTAGQRENYLPEQGELALRLLKQFLKERWIDDHKFKGLPAVFVISPFKSVAQEFRGLLLETRAQWAGHIPYSTFDKWMKASVGTAHTFQGKEQESVILLLGGATDGAIRWASGSPNLLNVAVTRAQRRLYVLGDRARWAQNPLARSLTERLPVESRRIPDLTTAQEA